MEGDEGVNGEMDRVINGEMNTSTKRQTEDKEIKISTVPRPIDRPFSVIYDNL